ncbi:MAG: hypothetical protein IJD52_05365 [Alphaproteobacteria bacterium]|nr:hypothetical protein [Alphaproteobacteria bacterium]
MALGKKRVDYKLSEAIAPCIIYGIGAAVILFFIVALMFDSAMAWIAVIAWCVFDFVMIKQKAEIAKRFTVKPDNKFTIKDVKEYFGTPINVIQDSENSYYTFEEQAFKSGLLAIFQTIHTFTTDKNGVVIKHEMDL